MIEFFRGTVTPRDWATSGGIVGFAVVLCVAFYFVVHSSQQSKLQEIKADDRTVVAGIRRAREAQKNIDELDAEVAKTQEWVSQFEERLPESREIPTLFNQFEGLAREIGLRVKITQLDRQKEARKETIPYEIVAWGNFHQIADFVNRLERFQRYLKVSDLDIGEQEEGASEASFTLSTYRFLQKGEGGGS